MKLLGFAGIPTSSTAVEEWQRYLARLGHSEDAVSSPDLAFAGIAAGQNENRTTDCLCIFKGNPRWNNNFAPHTDMGHTILAAYKRLGEGLLNHLEGSFALAIIDLAKRRVLLAIDRMGIERMTFALNGPVLAFGTSAEEVARSPSCRFSLNQQGLYDFLMMHMIPAPNTIYQGVHKLRPGTMAIFEQNKLRINSYWKPQFIENATSETFADWKTELHNNLAAAVRSCAPDNQTGTFLSGGLDSSSVTGMLAKISKTPARTFSMGFGVDAYDELHYARIAAKRFGCDAFEYHVTPEDIVAAFPLIASAYDEPFGNSSAVPTYICALRAREQGITHLLAGDGGDEIFGGNERYVRQRVFELYQHIPSALRKSIIEPLSRLFPAEGGLMPLRKIRSYIEQASIPLPERLESWNFIYRHGTKTMLEPEFASSINPRAPFTVMDEVYHAAPSRAMLHQMLYYDWHFTLSDNDLRKVGTMCELAGVKISYPMLDQRVIDLSTRIPPNKKIEGMELRSFYKKAMIGFLPDEILNKTKHGFGLPFGTWLKTHQPLADLIYSHLQALKQRHIVQSSFIDQLIDDHKKGHASYFGYAIWDLAMLEAWLQKHAGTTFS